MPFVVRFPEQIAPLAVAIAQRLVETFAHLVASDRGEDEDGQHAFLTTQTLSTIVCVVDATQYQPEALQELEALLVPMLGQLLTGEMDDQFEYMGTYVAF